jgi:S-formylglutathione hydrolase FrmB
LTIIEPTFGIDPWYANSSTDPGLQYETFMTSELRPWVTANLATTHAEQHWLIGFSKSGLGGQDLILKHPDLFSLAASWDFPADMSTYSQYNAAQSYGTDTNFQANYRLTTAFIAAHRASFLTRNRLWIEGGSSFPADDSDYDALLTSEGVAHTTGTAQPIAHRWDSGWVPTALAALYRDSIAP